MAFSLLGKGLGPFQVHPLLRSSHATLKIDNTIDINEASELLAQGEITDEQFITIFEEQRRTKEGEDYQPLIVPNEYHIIYQKHLWTIAGSMERRSGAINKGG